MKTTMMTVVAGLVVAGGCGHDVELQVDLSGREAPVAGSERSGPAALDELAWAVTDGAPNFHPHDIDWTADGGLVAGGSYYESSDPDGAPREAYVSSFGADGGPLWTVIISHEEAERLARTTGEVGDGQLTFQPYVEALDTFPDGGVLLALRLIVEGTPADPGPSNDWVHMNISAVQWYGADGSVGRSLAFSSRDEAEGMTHLRDVLALPDGGGLLSGASPIGVIGDGMPSAGALTRMDEAGERLWTVEVVSAGLPPTIGIPRVKHLSLLPDGGVVFGGEFFGDITIAGERASGDGLYAARLEDDGSLVWMRTLDGTVESLEGLAVMRDGNLVAAGSFYTHVSAGDLELEHVPIGEERTPFVAEMDPSGAFVQLNEMEPLPPLLAAENQGRGTVMTAAGHHIAFGGHTNEFDVNQGMGTPVSSTAFAALYGRDGRLLDERRMVALPADPDETANSSAVAVSADGHLALAGYFNGAADFGDGPVRSTGGFIAVYEPPPADGVDIVTAR